MIAPAAPPLQLRISVTDRCQLRCTYCMPFNGIPMRPHRDILSFEEIARFVRELQTEFDLVKVRITGGEPLVRRGIVDLVAMLAELNIRDLALTTNAQGLAGLAADLKRAGLRRLNVNLHSVNAATYANITRGGVLEQALDGIREALRAGLSPVKTNTVVIRGQNDGELADIARFVLSLGCRARFLELMPIAYARPDFERAFVPSAEILARLAGVFKLTPMDSLAGANSRDFQAADGSGIAGIVGLIASESSPFCGGCTRLRLTSTGELITCLARGKGIMVRDLLRSGAPDAGRTLRTMVAAELAGKRHRASFETPRPMAAVGG